MAYTEWERYLRGSKPDLSVVAPTPDLAVVGANEDSSAAQAPAIPGLKETSAKPLRKPIGKSIWLPVAILFLVLVVVAYAARNSATAVAGFSVAQLISIELILFLLGVALHLNRRQWPFTALNSWTGSLSGGFKSWLQLHLNRRQLRFFEFAGQFSWRARVISSRKRQ